MLIHARFFALYRDRVGDRLVDFDVPDDATVADIEERSGVPVTVGEYDLAQSLRRCLDDHGTNLSHGQGRQLSELGFFVGRKS